MSYCCKLLHIDAVITQCINHRFSHLCRKQNKLTCYNLRMSLNTTVPSTMASDLDQFLNHLYTPYGVAVVAVVAILLTSLVWTISCCVYCCCRWTHRDRQSGDLEASREMTYYGMGSTDNVPQGVHSGTMSSGYNTGPPASTSSLTQMDTDYGTQNTSMDSILESSY